MEWLVAFSALLVAPLAGAPDVPEIEATLPVLDIDADVSLDAGVHADLGGADVSVTAYADGGLDPRALLWIGPPAPGPAAPASEHAEKRDDPPTGAAAVWARLRPMDLDAGATASAGMMLSLAFASGLFSRIQGPAVLRHPLRRELHDAVTEHPGASPRELQALLERPWGTIAYHLRRLESAGLLVSGSDGRSIRFWQAGTGRVEKQEGLALGTGRRRAVAELVQATPGIRPSQLSVRLGVGRAAVSKHLRSLGASGIVRVERDGATARCYPIA